MPADRSSGTNRPSGTNGRHPAGDRQTQDDVDAGRIVLVVGVVPLRPAELVQLRFVLQALGGGPGEAPDAGE